MSNVSQTPTQADGARNALNASGVSGGAWHEARAAYRSEEPPAGLEATLLARFGELRAEAKQADQTDAARAIVKTPPAAPSWWQRALSLTRLHPACASGFSLSIVLAIAAPWWLQWMTATPESTTPFMLVSEPSGGQLNVAQMVRVSVAREAMLDFGIPVPPQKLQEPVRAEMLLGPRGEMLAVRFIERPAKKRFSFD